MIAGPSPMNLLTSPIYFTTSPNLYLAIAKPFNHFFSCALSIPVWTFTFRTYSGLADLIPGDPFVLTALTNKLLLFHLRSHSLHFSVLDVLLNPCLISGTIDLDLMFHEEGNCCLDFGTIP
jgi:hypothetical protein